MLDGLLSSDEATDACWYQLHQEKDGSGCLSVSDQDRRSRQAYISITTMEALRQMSLIKRQLDIETSDLTTILQMRPEALISLIRKACSSAGLQGTYAGDSPKAGMILDLLQFGFSLSQVAYSGGWATQRKAARFICSIAGGRELLAQLLSQNQGDTKPICSPERCTHDDKKNALFMSGVPSPFCCGRGQQRSCQ